VIAKHWVQERGTGSQRHRLMLASPSSSQPVELNEYAQQPPGNLEESNTCIAPTVPLRTKPHLHVDSAGWMISRDELTQTVG
jgi:hypothetical protein